jgi:hypothetical protein
MIINEWLGLLKGKVMQKNIKELFKLFGYKKHRNLYFKIKDDILMVINFHKICHSTVLRVEASLTPILYDEECWVYGDILSIWNRGLLFHGIKEEYAINVSAEELGKVFAEIEKGLKEKVLPFLENLPISNKEFCKKYLLPNEKFLQALFEINYHQDYEKALFILENLKKRKNMHMTDNEQRLYDFLMEDDKEQINKLLKEQKEKFKRKNHRYVK